MTTLHNNQPRPMTARERHREAMWECMWMCCHGQGRLVTFRNIRALGFDRRTAAEMIQDCEHEG